MLYSPPSVQEDDAMKCSECNDLSEWSSWRSHEVNQKIEGFRDSYISPVKIYHEDIQSALRAWGEEIHPEDLL